MSYQIDGLAAVAVDTAKAATRLFNTLNALAAAQLVEQNSRNKNL